jgi:hypothetical protein
MFASEVIEMDSFSCIGFGDGICDELVGMSGSAAWEAAEMPSEGQVAISVGLI